MNTLSLVRLLVGVGLLLALLVALILVLQLSDLAFSVWERLRHTPPWFIALYGGGVAALLTAAGWLIWRLLGQGAETPVGKPLPPPVELDHVESRIARNLAAEADVAEARRELDTLARRKAAGEVVVVLAGTVSAGKSTLVTALLPGARVVTSPVAGSTRELERHEWTTPAGDRVTLVDLPGFQEVGGVLESLAREEALRAHAVVYLCEGDLTREQFNALQRFAAIGKPLILAVNKSDRLDPGEQALVKGRLRERLDVLDAPVEVVFITSGGQRPVIRVLPDGREVTEQRPVAPEVEALRQALQRRLEQDPEALERLRDVAVFTLAAAKLDEALVRRRRERAEALVADYARKAVVGATAAVTPGLDVVVQGYLGLNLIKELCQVYDTPVRQLEIDQLLKQVDLRAARTLPLLLAVVGNVLKSFPGAGTVAGGLMHAVAYGLLFDSLGRAVARTLESRGELSLQPALGLFEENLSQDLDKRILHLAQAALEGLLSRKGDKR